MRTEVTEFKRKDLFEYYDSRTNPFLFVTAKIDITNIVNYCKKNRNYYATIGYFIYLVANEMDCFKYRKENDKIYKYDKLYVNFTQMIDVDKIGFFSFKSDFNYNKFIEKFNKKQTEFKNKKENIKCGNDGEIWLSCCPWFEFSSLITPFDKSITIPQFTWSKFYNENEKTYTNLTIMGHHGFIDGYHISIFLQKLNDKINKFDEIINKEV